MKKLHRGEPGEKAHRHVVGTILVGSELLSKVGEREEAVGIIETLLILPVAAFNLAVMSGRERANELVADVEVGGSGFKEGEACAVFDREAIGKLRAVVRLNALHPDAAACIPGNRLFEEVRGREGTLFLVRAEETQAGELINGGVLEEAQGGIGDTASGNNLHVDLHALARVRHLLVRFGNRLHFLLRRRQHTKTMEDAVERADMPVIASFA